MAVYRVQGPDGAIHRFEGPDNATPEQVTAAAEQQFGAAQSTPQSYPADTAATDPLAQQMPNPRTQTVQPTGYRAQVNRTMSGNGPAPMTGSDGTDVARFAGNAAGGALSSAVGMPGDIESLLRTGSRFLGAPISGESLLPTTRGVETAFMGAPTDRIAQGGRMAGELLGPSIAKQAVTATGKAGGWLLKQGLGLSTGAGDAAIQGAYNAGKEGGQAGQLFRDQMRGDAPASDVVQTAKQAVAQLKADRSVQYTANASSFKGDKTVLDMQPILDAVNKSSSVGTFKGQTLSSGADKVSSRIAQEVQDWAKLNPADFHTAEGLDALKQKIGNLAYEEDLKPVAGPGTPGSVIVDRVYNAVKDQIQKQAPGYAKTMADYSVASDTIRELEKGFSLGNKATVDTALRKLQSVMRNNVNTNYGQRQAMGDVLDTASNGALTPQIAGQALNSWTPRGIQRILAGGEALASMHPAALPYTIPALMASSPRLVGEGAHLAGRAVGGAKSVIPPMLAQNPALLMALLQRSSIATQPASVAP